MESMAQKEICTVTISADFMKADLHYQPAKRGEGETAERTASAADIQQLLRKAGVEYGIDLQAIERVLLTQMDTVQKVASGQAAVPGKDGTLEFFADYSGGLAPPKLDWGGTADFREINVIPEIEEGSLIAKKNSSVPGIDGRTVTGKIVPAPPVKEVVVHCGTGVYEQDNHFFAAFSGRLLVEKRGNKYKLDVSKQFIHPGSVNLSSGNIRFQGDVEVRGNVESAMRVEAAGNAAVHGYLSSAVVIAGKSASVQQNVFSSTISSGKMVDSVNALTQSLSGCLPVIMEFSVKIKHFLLELKNRGRELDAYIAVQKLIEKNFPDLPEQIKKFAYVAAQAGQSVQKEWTELANKLYRLIVMKSPQSFSFELLEEAVSQALFLQSFYQEEEEEDELFVSIPYAVNSDIMSNKHVYVTGQGVFNSTIKAGGRVEVAGCVKGGTVCAGTLIKVKEAGSESGVKTKFQIEESGKIEFLKVYPEVTVQFGMKHLTFDQAEGPVCLFTDDEGRIKKAGLTVTR